MNAQTDPMLRFEEASDRPAADIGWRVALPLTAAATVILLAIYWDTAKSMVATWSGSETFAHGYVIVPIALVLAWGKRRELARLVPAADYAGLVLLAAAGLAWLVAAAGQVQVVQQYAMTAMIPALVLALAGRDVARALAFPLAFLLLAVPVGDAFIPRLMDWTADFTVAALRLTGIPVYREGTFFSIPTGNWSVVEACSGLRYLIASVTVGVLYAYLNYQRLWKRLFFVGLSALVPLAANGVRAYLIVMIGHLSGMKLAVGIDHLIYGWIFFGLVMLLLFWLGSFWRDPVRRADEEVVPLHTAPSSSAALAASAVAALAIAAAWPLYAAHLERANGAIGAPVLARPAGAAGWSSETLPLTDWRPRYSGAAASSFELYRKGDRAVALYVGYYRGQRKGAELVTSGNVIVAQGDPLWMNVGDSARTEDLGNGPVDMRETRLRSARQRLLVWDWYRVAGSDLSNPYVAKLLLARDKLLYRGDDAAVIMLATPYEIRTQAAEEALREFARAMLPSINAALAGAASGEPAPMHAAH